MKDKKHMTDEHLTYWGAYAASKTPGRRLMILAIRLLSCSESYRDRKEILNFQDIATKLDSFLINIAKDHFIESLIEAVDADEMNCSIAKGIDCDIYEEDSLDKLLDSCLMLILLYFVHMSSHKSLFANESSALSALDRIITLKSAEAIGYWIADTKRIRDQGSNSREIGQLSEKIVEDVLSRLCNGIDGYKDLDRGEKKLVIDKLRRRLKFKDDRQIYNILNKLKKVF